MGGIGAGGQVLAFPGVVVVAEGGHAREGVASQGVGMTEVGVGAHILAHPEGGIVQLGAQAQAAEPVGGAILVYQAQEGVLFAVQRRRRTGRTRQHEQRQHDGEGKEKKACPPAPAVSADTHLLYSASLSALTGPP